VNSILVRITRSHADRLVAAEVIPKILALNNFDHFAEFVMKLCLMSPEQSEFLMTHCLPLLMMSFDNFYFGIRDFGNFVSRGSKTQLVPLFREALSHPRVTEPSLHKARHSVYSSFLAILVRSHQLPNFVLQAVIDAEVIETALALMCTKTDLPTHETCRDILISFGNCCSCLKWSSNLFSTFASFSPRGPRRKADLNSVYNCLSNLITRCADQSIIIESGIISTLLSQETSEELVRCVLGFATQTFFSFVEEKEREKEFLDHLVDSGLIPFFVSALKSMRLLQKSTSDAVVTSLQMIRKFNPRYLKILQDLKLPRLLEPVIMGHVEMEEVYLKLLLHP
jgi:hypothetical protein